jgi:hypothetical protein
MTNLASRLLSMLKEMERVITNSPESSSGNDHPASRALVDYVVETPKGSRTRFQRGVGLNQIGSGNPQSETAVLGYLRKQHPGTDIQINNISFD